MSKGLCKIDYSDDLVHIDVFIIYSHLFYSTFLLSETHLYTSTALATAYQ